MRARQLTSLALIVPSLLALAALAAPAAAQDGGEEAGGAETAEPEGPPVEPSIRFVDRRSNVEIQLPKNWKAEKFNESTGQLAHWIWPTPEGGALAGVTLLQRTDAMRAPLVRWHTLQARELVEGTLRGGDGWAEACGIERDQLAVYERYVEKDGIVWVAQFVCHKNNLEDFRERVIVPALESFEVVGSYEHRGLPDGWSEEKVKDYVLWTEADDDNVDDAEGLVEQLLDMGKLARKVLDGDPHLDQPTRIAIIQNGSLFEDLCVAATGQKPDNAIYDPRQRRLLVKWMARNSQGFEHDYHQFAAAQLVAEHYGGNLPFWLSGGLRMYVLYGFQDGGKPQKPDDERMGRTKAVISRAKLRLDQWFTTKLQDVPDTNAGFAEVWAWNWFFRHARQGKKYRKTYEKCLETLLETGDPEQAYAVWEGTDFEEMFEDFKKWGESID